ncbi:MAG: alkaline phosphatase D family protein, partial [Planctomycetales bacterium]|nr:alkaline phosphatase D family protein [Planctomycetales bacterium]
TQELQVGAFKWLLKHLTGNEPVIDSAALKEIAPKDLLVFTRETPLNERVSTLADWFVPQPTAVLEPKSAAELWRTRWLPELRRLGTLPSAATPPTQFVSQAQGRLADGKRWDLYRSEGDEPAIQIYHVAGDNAATPVIHLGIADTSEWDGQSAESWWALESVQRVLAAMPDRGHYFVKWRGAHWLPQTERAKKRNQLVRRFYLLGQSPERLATCDFIAAAKWIASRSDASQGIELAGQGRSAAIALLAGLCLQAEEPDKQLVRGLRIEAFTAEPLLAPMLVGYLRVCNFDSLRAAAEALFPVHTGADPADSPAPLLVETSHEPQQANGLRIVEVSQQQAHVWVRATRWPLPNLGDLPEVQFEGSADSEGKRKVQRQVVPILPDAGVAGLRYALPGVRAQARVGYRPQSGGSWTYSEWREVRAESDYSTIFALDSLQPGSGYEVRTEVRGLGREDVSSRLVGEFKTLPAAAEPATFRLAVGTCQGFDDRDGDHGFDVYRTMLDRHTDALVMAGDVVYYDSLARNTDLAYYHWQRTYGLPTLVEFHRRVPSYFLKDDHDTYVDDSWPGKRLPWTGEFTFEDGQRIFRQQTALPQTPYRTFHIGSDLQIWLMEGRDFRSPNNAPDSPQKSIWGEKQKEWLKSTLENSTAKFRVVISPTPLVGPDRDGKRDNHSNSVFATEGKEMRALLAAQPNTVAICGDRHWQYHSVDPESGLHEFSVGPVSDRHAEGWMQEDFRPEIHKYLRVAGGYLELDLSGESGARRLTLRHLDTTGREHHQFTLQ